MPLSPLEWDPALKLPSLHLAVYITCCNSAVGPMSRCPIVRHLTIKDIEEISGHMLQTVQCCSVRYRTVVVHKLKFHCGSHVFDHMTFISFLKQ